MCGSIPNVLVIKSINISQLNFMFKARKESLEAIVCSEYQLFPGMTVPKLRSYHFEEFDLTFQGDARRQVGLSGI